MMEPCQPDVHADKRVLKTVCLSPNLPAYGTTRHRDRGVERSTATDPAAALAAEPKLV
jgi:hypothetical protein